MLLYNEGSQASIKWHLMMGSVCWRLSTRVGVPMDPGSQWTPVSPIAFMNFRAFLQWVVTNFEFLVVFSVVGPLYGNAIPTT